MAVVPIASEFIVNTTTANSQVEPQVAALSNGRLVFVWEDSSGAAPDTTGAQIRARILNADGSAFSTTDFTANTTTAGGQFGPSVAALANGRFVVTWADNSGLGNDPNTAVRGRVFNADGTGFDITDQQINTTTAGSQFVPSVAGLSATQYVVAWSDGSGVAPETGAGIRARIMTYSGGGASPNDFLVNTTYPGPQVSPAVTALSETRFVVTWTDNGSFDVRGRIFDNTGAAVTANDFLINTSLIGQELQPTVTPLANGGFVAVWADAAQDQIRGRVFDANGVPATADDFIIASGESFSASVAAMDDGRFIVVWDEQPAAFQTDIYGRIMNADGTGAPEFVINTINNAGSQFTPSIARVAFQNDRFAVTWADSGVGDGALGGIRASIFEVNEKPTGAPVTINAQSGVLYSFAAQTFNFADADSGDTLAAIRIESLPAQGTLAIGNTPVVVGQVIQGFSLLGLVFDPGNGSGPNFASFSVSLFDGTEFSAAPVPVTINVSGGQQVTVAAPDALAVVERLSATGNVLTNDAGTGLTVTQAAAGGGALEAVPGSGLVLTGAYGALTINPAGGFAYNASAEALVSGQTYVDSFTYAVSGASGAAQAVLTVTVTGSPEGNAINNIIIASPAGSVMNGYDGEDLIVGGAGADTLNGGNGNDVLDGGAGNDTLSGGDGGDVASYFWATGDVTVSVAVTGPQNTGGSGTDTLSGIEILVGSAFNDVLSGDAFLNYLVGADGNDVLSGGGGGDVLVGGAGADFFVIGAAAHSTPLAPDIIADVQSGTDKIDFRAVRSGPADTVSIQSVGPYTMVTLDHGGNGTPDVRVLMAGNAPVTLADVLLTNPAATEAELAGGYLI